MTPPLRGRLNKQPGDGLAPSRFTWTKRLSSSVGTIRARPSVRISRRDRRHHGARWHHLLFHNAETRWTGSSSFWSVKKLAWLAASSPNKRPPPAGTELSLLCWQRRPDQSEGSFRHVSAQRQKAEIPIGWMDFHELKSFLFNCKVQLISKNT